MKLLPALLTLSLVACAATNKTPQVAKFDPKEPVFKRYTAYKNDLLYTYRVEPGSEDRYSTVLKDADKWCSQHSMMAVERTYPSCQEYNYANDVSVRYCSVAFKCQ